MIEKKKTMVMTQAYSLATQMYQFFYISLDAISDAFFFCIFFFAKKKI